MEGWLGLLRRFLSAKLLSCALLGASGSLPRVAGGNLLQKVMALLVLLLAAVAPIEGATLAGRVSGRLLLRNAVLANQGNDGSDVVVNLLVVDGVLTAVSRDQIPADEADVVVDCQGKVAYGVFMVDKPANLFVLDEDPRENMDVLLDTRSHLVFAIRDGRIVRNTLPISTPLAPRPQKRRERVRWIGYIPPPVALPVSYRTTEHWNEWRGKAISGVVIGAMGIDRQQWVAQDADSKELSGDLSEYNGGEIRAIRFGAVGTLNLPKPWVYTVFLTSKAFDQGFDGGSSSSLKVYDLRLDVPLPKRLTLSFGKMKEPISMERLAGGFYLPLLERAAALDAMLPARDIGVSVSRVELGGRLSWAGGVFNNWLDAPGGPGKSSNTLAGRVTWLPMRWDKAKEVLHLGLGLRYTDGKAPVRYATEPEMKQAPLFVDTGPLDAANALTLDLEAAWRKGPIWVSGEYQRSSVRDAAAGDPVFRGFNITASWIVTGEVRSYDTRSATFGLVRPKHPVGHGGWGAWEVSTRYSTVDLNEGRVHGGAMDIFSLGGSWYLTDAFHLRLDYRHVKMERAGYRGTSDGFLLRLVLMLD